MQARWSSRSRSASPCADWQARRKMAILLSRHVLKLPCVRSAEIEPRDLDSRRGSECSSVVFPMPAEAVDPDRGRQPGTAQAAGAAARNPVFEATGAPIEHRLNSPISKRDRHEPAGALESHGAEPERTSIDRRLGREIFPLRRSRPSIPSVRSATSRSAIGRLTTITVARSSSRASTRRRRRRPASSISIAAGPRSASTSGTLCVNARPSPTASAIRSTGGRDVVNMSAQHGQRGRLPFEKSPATNRPEE